MIKFRRLLTGIIKGLRPLNAKLIYKQKLAAATAWQILNYYSNRTIPKEWLKYNDLRGVLLADEVGGGKTFEALAIISQAFLSSTKNKRKRFRVLIIAAPAIRSKWEWRDETEIDKWCDLKRFVEQSKLSKSKKELLESFFKSAQKENIITLKRHWKERYNNLRQGIWITSFGGLPNTKGRRSRARFARKFCFPSGSFDYIIADEAHIVKSGYIDSDENISSALNNSAIRKIYAVLNENPKAKLLLLTATPFQNNLNEFIHMISLIERPNDGDCSVVKIIDAGLRKLYKEIESLKTENNESEIEKRVQHLINAFDNEVGKLIYNEKEAEHPQRPKSICKNGRRSGLDDFLRDVMIRNNKEPLKVIPKEISLNDGEKLQYLLFRDVISHKQEDEKDMFSVKLSQMVSSDAAFSNSFRQQSRKNKYSAIKKLFNNKNLIFERKFDNLLEIINKKIVNNKKVIVVFCRFIPTIKTLESRFKKVPFPDVFLMDGKTVVEKRKVILEKVGKRNKDANSHIIFLVSQVGNEGLDFDSFSDTVIHFDGHYNPAVIDQRNGRVYRRDNISKDISVKHVYLKDTYDQRIKFIELEKRKMKDFFLGDKGLNIVFEKIFTEKNIKEKKKLLKELEKIKIDLGPKAKYLLPEISRIL